MNIALLFGGKSGEHEVSLVSAASIARHIDTAKHTVYLIGISKTGRWYLQDESELARIKADATAALTITERPETAVSVVPGGGRENALCVHTAHGTRSLPADIVFPALHGTFGEDGTIQGLCEMAELPYCGCAVMSSSLTMDKEKTKQVWLAENLPVVPFCAIRKHDRADKKIFEEKIAWIERSFLYPVFVKPCCAGSSVGASKAENRAALLQAIDGAFEWDNKILVEQYIPAREIECAVTGNTCSGEGPDVHAYIPGEIAPAHDFYDYDAKYNDPDGASLLIPADLPAQQLEQIRQLAVKAYKALDASGFSRMDFFIDKNTGAVYLNEINTIPGFTSISMFPKMCEAGGLSYPEQLELIMQLGISRFNEQRALKTSRI